MNSISAMCFFLWTIFIFCHFPCISLVIWFMWFDAAVKLSALSPHFRLFPRLSDTRTRRRQGWGHRFCTNTSCWSYIDIWLWKMTKKSKFKLKFISSSKKIFFLFLTNLRILQIILNFFAIVTIVLSPAADTSFSTFLQCTLRRWSWCWGRQFSFFGLIEIELDEH